MHQIVACPGSSIYCGSAHVTGSDQSSRSEAWSGHTARAVGKDKARNINLGSMVVSGFASAASSYSHPSKAFLAYIVKAWGS